MEEIIRRLKELKQAVAAGIVTDSQLDLLNQTIRSCEKKKELFDAVSQPAQMLRPLEDEMAPGQYINITIENIMIQIDGGEGKTIPPGSE